MTKLLSVYSFSVVVEQDGELVPIMQQQFKYGEACLIKYSNRSEVMVIKHKWLYDQITNFLRAIDYDIMERDSHSFSLIAFNHNPARLMIRINGTPMSKLQYQDFPEDSALTAEQGNW